MESFKEYIAHPDSITMPTAECLGAVIDKYAWFTTARMVRSHVQGVVDPRVMLRLQTRGAGDVFLREISIDDFWKRSTIEIIDSFLSKGEYKIVPNDDTPEYEIDIESADGQDDFLSEELAEIYLAQGMIDEAKETYKKLSLLYPKKSVYFAEIIERIS